MQLLTVVLLALNVGAFAIAFAMDIASNGVKIKLSNIYPAMLPLLVLGGPGILLYVTLIAVIDLVFNILGGLFK